MRHKMPTPGDKTTRTMVWAIVSLTGITLAAVVLLVTFAPPGEDRRAVVLQVLGMLAPTVAVLVTLRQVGQVQHTTEQVARDTHDLTNGLLESKVRTGVADVLHPNLLDPQAEGQLQEDRAVVEDRKNGET